MHRTEEQTATPLGSPVRRIGRAVADYLKDWRNLLGHALLGVVFLVLAIWAPVDLRIKLAVIACLVAFNVARMRRAARRPQKAEERGEP